MFYTDKFIDTILEKEYDFHIELLSWFQKITFVISHH